MTAFPEGANKRLGQGWVDAGARGGGSGGVLPLSRVSTPSRTRTCNLMLRRQMLYPLSYGGIFAYY